MKNKIDILRKQIDLVDDKIIGLLAKRLVIVKKIGEWKKQKGLPVLDSNRWQKVLGARMKKAKRHGIDPKFIQKIYEAIHEEALKVEEKI